MHVARVHPCKVLPHELVHYFMVHNHDWEAKKEEEEPVELSLWGDSVPYTKKKSLFTMVLGIKPVENQTRLPVLFLPGEKSPVLLEALLEALQWSFVCLLTGVFPDMRYLKGPQCLKGKSVL